MARRIKGDDGKIYVEQQPFYKRGWFWVLIIFVVVALIFGVTNLKNRQSSAVKHQPTIKKVSPKYYKVGDTVKVGKVTYTLKSVDLTQERNEFEDSQPKYVVKVVYHVKNNSKKDIPIGTDMTAYGPRNNKLKSYPVSDITLDSVAAGKEADVTDGFSTDKLGTFEFQLAPTISTEKPAKFRVKIKKSSSNKVNTQSQQAEQYSTNNDTSNKAESKNDSENIPSSYYDEDAYKDTYKANMTPKQRYDYDMYNVYRGAAIDAANGIYNPINDPNYHLNN